MRRKRKAKRPTFVPIAVREFRRYSAPFGDSLKPFGEVVRRRNSIKLEITSLNNLGQKKLEKRGSRDRVMVLPSSIRRGSVTPRAAFSPW